MKQPSMGDTIAEDAIHRSLCPLPIESSVSGSIVPAPSAFGRLLCQRRSERSFSGKPIPQSVIERVMADCAGGVKTVFDSADHPAALYRTIPQGGGICSIGVGVIILRTAGCIDVGVYKLCPHSNSLHSLNKKIGQDDVAAAIGWLPNDADARNASAILVIYADIAAKTYKYSEDLGYRLCLIEAGCALQNALLSMCDQGLAGYARCGFNAEQVSRLLDLAPSDQMPIVTVVLGVPEALQTT